MLVLSRKIGQKILLNNGEITLVVVDIRGDRVRLGFQAPPEVTIHREEVQDHIDRQNRENGPGWQEGHR